MIRSFRDEDTQKIASRTSVPRFKAFERVALRKLDQIDAAASLDDLRAPPGNHLEALRGDRKGQYSIRINEKFRVCFIWNNWDAYEVEITDYH